MKDKCEISGRQLWDKWTTNNNVKIFNQMRRNISNISVTFLTKCILLAMQMTIVCTNRIKTVTRYIVICTFATDFMCEY